MTSTASQRNGPAKVAALPSRGSNNPSQDIENMKTDITDHLRMAMASCDQVESMIHAAWMAARFLDKDSPAEGAALQAVIHSAGEWMQEVRGALRKAGAV